LRRRGPPWRWCWRRRGPGRPPKPRIIASIPPNVSFIPHDEAGAPLSAEPIFIMPDELEALRLVYLEGLTQQEASERMGISRGTLWRLLDNGRRKLVLALVERRPIVLTSRP